MPDGAAATARAGVVPANYELQCKSRISFGATPSYRSRRVCPVRHSTNSAQTKRRGDAASGCSHARCGAARALYVLRRALRALLGGCGERCASPRRSELAPEPEEAASWSEVSAFARPRDGPQDAHGPASASTRLLVVYLVRRAIVGLPERTGGCALLRKVLSERTAQPLAHLLSTSRGRVARAVLEVEAYWSARTVRTARAAAREGAGGQPWASHRPGAPRKAAVGERAANTCRARHRRLARASTLFTAALSASPAHCLLARSSAQALFATLLALSAAGKRSPQAERATAKQRSATAIGATPVSPPASLRLRLCGPSCSGRALARLRRRHHPAKARWASAAAAAAHGFSLLPAPRLSAEVAFLLEAAILHPSHPYRQHLSLHRSLAVQREQQAMPLHTAMHSTKC